jgi:hypothetical protein
MARRYEKLTDEELDAKILAFTTALEEIALGGEVSKIQSDGKLMELVRGNTGGADAILTLLLEERDMRGNDGVLPGRALGMRFYR